MAMRKSWAIWLDSQKWVPGCHWLTQEIIRDFLKNDPDSYHCFLWSNHLAYAESYEINQRFGSENIHTTRHMLLSDLKDYFSSKRISLHKDVDSIFDVGCSLGYFLHYLETDVCLDATTFEGVDIDGYAIRTGKTFLNKKGSKTRIFEGEITNLESVMGNKCYDLVFCLGVLLYLTEDKAASVINEMLNHANKLVVISGLAHPKVVNSKMRKSEGRKQDGGWIHNIDEMVNRAGGTVLYRRWQGDRIVDENTIYFIFCCRNTKSLGRMPHIT